MAEGSTWPAFEDPAEGYSSAVSRAFGQTIAAAGEQQARLQTAVTAAQRLTYQGESADGMIRVTVDGRPRVTAVQVNPRALRYDADSLGQAIAEAANAAVRASKDGTNRAVLAGLGPGLRAAVADGLAAAVRLRGEESGDRLRGEEADRLRGEEAERR
jgi:DNA-binding protein YbaB